MMLIIIKKNAVPFVVTTDVTSLTIETVVNDSVSILKEGDSCNIEVLACVVLNEVLNRVSNVESKYKSYTPS